MDDDFDWGAMDEEIDAPPQDEEKNSYLCDYSKGMQLIAGIMGNKRSVSRREEGSVSRLDHLIDEDLLDSLKDLEIEDEMSISRRLRKISDRVEEYKKNKVLKGKTIIGIGGQFSAGKSAFINSLINDNLLMTDLSVATSISTYLVYGEKEQIWAFTEENQKIPLSLEAMQALTHDFYRTYKIGFSGFIKNLIVESPAFSNIGNGNHLVILDTPGYNNEINPNKKSSSDYDQARKQLRSVDYLIWLMDCEGSIPNQGDIDFLRSLNFDKSILIIINKADKKEGNPESLKSQAACVEEDFRNNGITLYGVTCYSSRNGQEYFGNEYIRKFLQDAELYANNKRSETDELKDIFPVLRGQLERNRKRNLESLKQIQKLIANTQDYNAIRSLIEVHKNLMLQKDEIRECGRNLDKVENRIFREIINL